MVLSMYCAGQGLSDLTIHVNAIAAFLRRHEWLWRAHVVDFFRVSIIPPSFLLPSRNIVLHPVVSNVFLCMNTWLDVQVKLWERVDEHWNSCLRLVSVENLLLLPSGVIQVGTYTTILTGC